MDKHSQLLQRRKFLQQSIAKWNRQLGHEGFQRFGAYIFGDAGIPSFFLDEATAFAAGHRPCFECRRDVAHYFRQCWVRGNPTDSFTETTSID
jgi:hypothetical protein